MKQTVKRAAAVAVAAAFTTVAWTAVTTTAAQAEPVATGQVTEDGLIDLDVLDHDHDWDDWPHDWDDDDFIDIDIL